MEQKHPKNISIQDFNYDLPQEKIAVYPLENRDQSKLLIYQNEHITELKYVSIDEEIPAESILFLNNSKVVEARLLFTKNTGTSIEIFCLEPSEIYADITSAMLQKQHVKWKCLVGGAKKWKEEFLTKKIQHNCTLLAKIFERKNDYFIIEFSWSLVDLSFAEVLHLSGEIPLPPYLNRAVEEKDKTTYQTVYAKHDGSVAAPTAGLHFTQSIFKKLEKKNIKTSFLTLHVGAGTFKPVKTDTMENHEMHHEFFEINIEAIESIVNNLNNNIIAVGTTSLRTIETLYWMGIKANLKSINCTIYDIEIQQWDPYNLPQNISAEEALKQLIFWMKKNNIVKLIAKTQIIIAPGYKLKIVNGLITNFHQPKSTLLLLVAAIVKNNWRKIYDFALQNNYRFLSYGDGSLLWYFKK